MKSLLLEAVLLCICLCGNFYHLSVFGTIIAIDDDYSTDFKFHPTRGCCFNSYNDVPQVAQRNVSIVANTRHRSPYLPQPDCCCFVLFLITPPPSRISAERIHGSRTGRGASFHRPTRLLLLCFNSQNDVPWVAQRNVSIVAHIRHRSPYLPQPDCCCFVSFFITRSLSTPHPPHLAQPDCCCVSILTTTTSAHLSRTDPWPQFGPRASAHAPTIGMIQV